MHNDLPASQQRTMIEHWKFIKPTMVSEKRNHCLEESQRAGSPEHLIFLENN